jgi:hypothetical protein
MPVFHPDQTCEISAKARKRTRCSKLASLVRPHTHGLDFDQLTFVDQAGDLNCRPCRPPGLARSSKDLAIGLFHSGKIERCPFGCSGFGVGQSNIGN